MGQCESIFKTAAEPDILALSKQNQRQLLLSTITCQVHSLHVNSNLHFKPQRVTAQ